MFRFWWQGRPVAIEPAVVTIEHLRSLADFLADHASREAYNGGTFTADGVRFAESMVRKLMLDVERGGEGLS